MTVLRLNLHLWKLKGLFEADMTQFFHPKFCSCIMLENQKSWNQSIETVLKIDLHLINLRWQNYFSSFSRPQWKNVFFSPDFPVQFLVFFPVFTVILAIPIRENILEYIYDCQQILIFSWFLKCAQFVESYCRIHVFNVFVKVILIFRAS